VEYCTYPSDEAAEDADEAEAAEEAGETADDEEDAAEEEDAALPHAARETSIPAARRSGSTLRRKRFMDCLLSGALRSASERAAPD